MALAVGAVLCLASGFLLVSLGWSRMGRVAEDLLLRGSLSVGFGLGLFSAIFFLSLMWRIEKYPFADLFAVTVLGAGFAIRLRQRIVEPEFAANSEERCPIWLRRSLAAAFVISVLAALYAGLMRMVAQPHGDGWDAFAIWNLHARFLFLGRDHWRDVFTGLLPGSHPDYPLLLPAVIAHFWTYLGKDDPRVPALIGFAFTFATAGVLFAALSILRGRILAMMATTALLATPSFIEQGTAQYADVPLGFFLLGTVVLLCYSDRWRGDVRPRRERGTLLLAGVAAGFAAWTKNEGLLFVGALAISTILVTIRGRQARSGETSDLTSPMGWSGLAALFAGIAPVLLMVAYFKQAIAGPGDLFSDAKTALPRLLTASRYWAIVNWYGKGFLRFGHWFWIPGSLLVLGLSSVLSKDGRRSQQAGYGLSVLALVLTLAGYFVVFLITPYDIYWHLRFSLLRLFLQLWPSTIFLTFLVLKKASRGATGEG